MFTSRSAREPVMAAVYGALNVSALTALAPVYNNVPQGIQPPWVLIQNPIETPNNTLGAQGAEVLLPVECASIKPSDLEVARLADKVRQLLDRANLTITGYALMACRWENDVPDEETLNGVHYRYLTSLFRFTVHQTS